MGRYRTRSRSRSRSYSPRRRSPSPPPPPPPPPPRRKRHDDRHHYDRHSSAPTGLLVRNVALDTRPDELRIPFEKFGPVKDVYLPRNYYTGEPRGFAFVKFRFPEDAAEAKDRLNYKIIGGREIRIVYAEENRKTPQEMRKSTRVSGSYGGRRASPRSPRRRYHSRSRSPVSGRRHSRSISRSRSPRSERFNRSTGRSMTPRDHSADGREERTEGSCRSPKEIPPLAEKVGYTSTKRSRSSTEMSPVNEKYKMSGRSITPWKESPLPEENKVKQRASDARDVSPDDYYRTNKGSISPQETPSRCKRRGTPILEISNQRDHSPDHERGHQLKHGSKSPGKNGGRPLREGSRSPSRSWSHSPHH